MPPINTHINLNNEMRGSSFVLSGGPLVKTTRSPPGQGELKWNPLTGRVLPAAQKPPESIWVGREGVDWGRWGPSCLIETNCSPLPGDTDSRPFVPAGLCWEQQKGNVLILARDKVRGFLLHASYLSLRAHPLEQAQRLSSSGACYILLD